MQDSATPKLLVVNGPAGVGKTTVAALLADANSGSAHVRGDDLKGFVVSKSDEARAGVTYRNGALVCSELLDSGYSFVVFDFVFNSGNHVRDFWGVVRPAVSFDAHFVTLWASEESLAARRRNRIEDARYLTLMGASRQAMSRQLAELEPVVITDNLTPQDVANTIMGTVLPDR